MEAITDRLNRLGLEAKSDARLESLGKANELGVTDALLTTLAGANRLARRSEIVLPAHRFEGLSRGRGWARKGKGGNATWGEREKDGYRCSAGFWTIGGNDGFSRKGETTWTVVNVTVGAETWTIAD